MQYVQEGATGGEKVVESLWTVNITIITVTSQTTFYFGNLERKSRFHGTGLIGVIEVEAVSLRQKNKRG